MAPILQDPTFHNAEIGVKEYPSALADENLHRSVPTLRRNGSSKETGGSLGDLIDGYGNKFDVPDFNINDIRKAIPKECFHKSYVRGLGYAGRDLFLLGMTFYTFKTYNTEEFVASPLLRSALWAVYAFLNGLFGTGLWVLAHECGHQALCPSKAINDAVGFVLHSALLVPYFSWKLSHRQHHKGIGHIQRDMVFVPPTRGEHCKAFGIPTEELHEVVQDAPLYSLWFIVSRLLLGWPLYLATNITGHDYHERQPGGRGKGKRNGLFGGVNHFSPASPLYESKDAHLILLSDVGILIMAALLSYAASVYGWSSIFRWYFAPYLWVNSWLIAITFLQHTDPSLPHYTAEAWTFVRGAACTIDRDLGFIGRELFHGIVETHVLHHYISTIPFYHAEKATEAMRPVMGRHYRADTSRGPAGLIRSLWTSARRCQWVEPAAGAQGGGKGVLFFRNRNGLGPLPKQV